MTRVFIDSSVLIAACGSDSGASSLVLKYAIEEKIKLYVSIDIIMEAKKNVILKMNEVSRQRLTFFLTTVPYTITSFLNKKEIEKCSRWIHKKDAPVLAAAIKSKTDFLLTLDKKHFIQPQVQKFAGKVRITTPGEFIRDY